MNNIYFTFVSDVFAEHSLSQCYHFAYRYIYIMNCIVKTLTMLSFCFTLHDTRREILIYKIRFTVHPDIFNSYIASSRHHGGGRCNYILKKNHTKAIFFIMLIFYRAQMILILKAAAIKWPRYVPTWNFIY
jgi:hypothetical protein